MLGVILALSMMVALCSKLGFDCAQQVVQNPIWSDISVGIGICVWLGVLYKLYKYKRDPKAKKDGFPLVVALVAVVTGFMAGAAQ